MLKLFLTPQFNSPFARRSVHLGRYPVEIENMNAAYWELYDRFVTSPSTAVDDLLRDLPPSTPPSFMSFLTGCLQPDPDKRSTLDELLSHPYLSGIKPPSTPTSSPEQMEALTTSLHHLLAALKESGVKPSRKTTDFCLLSKQLNLPPSVVAQAFFPARPKASSLHSPPGLARSKESPRGSRPGRSPTSSSSFARSMGDKIRSFREVLSPMSSMRKRRGSSMVTPTGGRRIGEGGTETQLSTVLSEPRSVAGVS